MGCSGAGRPSASHFAVHSEQIAWHQGATCGDAAAAPESDVRDAAWLLFVVPPDVFDTLPCQPWQTVRGTEMSSVPAALQKLQQWVMELQVQPSPRSSNDGSGSSGPSSGRNSGGAQPATAAAKAQGFRVRKMVSGKLWCAAAGTCCSTFSSTCLLVNVADSPQLLIILVPAGCSCRVACNRPGLKWVYND